MNYLVREKLLEHVDADPGIGDDELLLMVVKEMDDQRADLREMVSHTASLTELLVKYGWKQEGDGSLSLSGTIDLAPPRKSPYGGRFEMN